MGEGVRALLGNELSWQTYIANVLYFQDPVVTYQVFCQHALTWCFCIHIFATWVCV